MRLLDLDHQVAALIKERGAQPLYKGYRGNPPSHPPFPGVICASVNDEVCHGLPDKRLLKAGDIVGIHNHGQLQIGDTLTEGENLGFKGIPYFSPEMFRAARLRDPLKSKQLQKGLQELGEEGAIQVFELEGGQMLLGAVGVLQFEIVAQRLKDEYKVDAIFEPADIHTARWLTFPDDVTRRNFEREQALRLGKDIDGNPVYLATSRYNLEVTAEKWPKVSFHATREHGEVLG